MMAKVHGCQAKDEELYPQAKGSHQGSQSRAVLQVDWKPHRAQASGKRGGGQEEDGGG